MKFSKRHLVKTITWRLIGTLDTLLLSWFISGDLLVVIQELPHDKFNSSIKSSNKRHVLKTFSWRAVGTLDTIILGWLITGNPMTGLKIGGAEVFTKMLLYFGHEKFWYRINFGLDKRTRRIAKRA